VLSSCSLNFRMSWARKNILTGATTQHDAAQHSTAQRVAVSMWFGSQDTSASQPNRQANTSDSQRPRTTSTTGSRPCLTGLSRAKLGS
jgi:hypothetical protein